jgi:PAS domain S-box-containing protein
VGTNEKGEKAIYLSKKYPLRDENNNIIGLIGTSIDITAQKQAEALELQQTVGTKDYLIEHSAGNLYWKDKQGRYLGCNANVSKMLNLNSAEDIVGKTSEELCFDILGAEDTQKVLDMDTKVIQDGIEITCEEMGFNAQGEKAVYLSKKSPLRDGLGNIVGLMGTSIDITKQKQADLIRSEFIRNMEHDIRTPLVGIYGMAEILQEQDTDPQRLLFITEILKSSQELMGYCEGILDFAKIQAHTYGIRLESCSLRTIVESVMAMNQPAARHKNLEMSLDYDEKVPSQITSDPHRLKRIVMNLLGNALKFTKVGFVKISVLLDRQDAEQSVVKIIIEDSGIGIAKEKQALLYEHFTRLNPSNQAIFKGLGLGLRIVKQFVTELEGDIQLDSDLGQGTRCTVTIPLDLK